MADPGRPVRTAVAGGGRAVARWRVPAARMSARKSQGVAIRRAAHADTDEHVAQVLVRLLHERAPPDAFAAQTASVQRLPDDHPLKASLLESIRRALEVRERLDQQQLREQGMLAVIESARDLSSRLDPDSLLAAIVGRARTLLGADVAWLSVQDTDRQAFQVLTTDGAMARGTARMVAGPGRGVASLVMSTRVPFTTPDYLHDTRFEHDPVLDDTFREEGICALVGVPLMWDGEVDGLLFVADRYHRVHSAQSIAILSTLATHAAVALKNARDFERSNAALERADRAHAELERHVRGIQAAADAHERMTSLLARGASLATLCQSVAQLLGGSLLVLDEAGRVHSRGTASGYDDTLAQACSAEDRQAVAMRRALAESRHLGRSVTAFEIDAERCRVMPVIGGDDLLGSLALFHRGELEEVAVRTFERSSSVIGIVLLSQERMEATKSRDMAALLRALVSPRQDDAALLADRAERHGLDLTRPLSLMLIEPGAPGAGYAARRLRTTEPRLQALVDEIDGVLVVLCRAAEEAEVRQRIASGTAAPAGAGHRGIVSRPVTGPAEIPALFGALRRGLAVLGRLGVQGCVVGQNELALYAALFETHDNASLTEFLEAAVGPLVAHDRRRGTELAPTLLAFLDANRNATLTAQRLGIHANTVRQRLAAVDGLLGDWDQPARALEIHVALRLRSLIATGDT